MRDSEISIETYRYQHERRQIDSKRPEEHQHAAADVTCLPRHGRVPPNFKRHHDCSDCQVGEREVHDEQTDARTTSMTSPERQENRQVADRRNAAKNGVDDDRHTVDVVEFVVYFVRDRLRRVVKQRRRRHAFHHSL